MALRFRRQALKAQATPHLGTLRVGHNPRFIAMALATLLIAGSLVGFATWTDITRKARLPGVLVPSLGTLHVSAPHTGVILEVLAGEGDEVNAGRVLVRIGTDRRSRQGDTVALVMNSLAQRRTALQEERQSVAAQARQRETALSDRLRNLQLEAKQAQDELKALQLRVELAGKTVDRFEQLSRAGFVSTVVAQQKQEELLDLRLREGTARRNLTALAREAETIRAEQAAVTTALQVQVSQMDRMLSTLDQESTEVDARGEVAVIAPQPAFVTSLSLHAGQSVQAGQTLASLVPTSAPGRRSALEAHLYAPSRAMGFIEPGQPVWLRYAAYPYQKFGMAQARIVSVSRTPVNPQDLPAGHAQPMLQAARSHEPLYRITASLTSQAMQAYGATHELLPGMAFDADVIQDRRSVWEWLVEPLIAPASRRPPSGQ
jgi:membrane fusion protein